MKRFHFHLIYLAVIAVLSFQNWHQKKALDLNEVAFIASDSAIIRNNAIIKNAAENELAAIKEQVRAYQNAVNEMYLSKANQCIRLSEEKTNLLARMKSELNASSSKSFFTPSEIQILKESITQFYESVESLIADERDRKIMKNAFGTAKFGQNPDFWRTFSSSTAGDVNQRLSVLASAIEGDKLAFLSYIFRHVGGMTTLERDRFIVTISPKKPALIEGENFEGYVYIAKYSSYSYAEIQMLVNGKSIPYKDGLAPLKLNNQTVGKKKLNLEARIRNPLTGQIERTLGEFEYEVFPKCSRDCQ